MGNEVLANTPKPKHVALAHETHIQPKRGNKYFILHNPKANTYLEIDARNYFLWLLMDGEHTLTDMMMAYFSRFGAFPFERLSNLIEQLKLNMLLEEKTDEITKTVEIGFVFMLKRFADSAFKKKFVSRHADGFFSFFYQHIGRLFFTKIAAVLFVILSVAGFACFILLEPTTEFQLLDINGHYSLGLITLLLANTILVFFHESGHALACKFYKRHIREAGIMFYIGMPVFFVDTTDMWMEKRKSALILVSLAGPIVNIVLGSLVIIVVSILPQSAITQALFQVAYLSYLIAFLNLNPLLELDGYYILMDWMEMPQLRKRSFAFIRNGLWEKILRREKFHYDDIIFSVYGLVALLFTVFMVLFVIYIWNSELKIMIQTLLSGKQVFASILFGGITFAAGLFLILGLGTRAYLWMNSLFIHPKTKDE